MPARTSDGTIGQTERSKKGCPFFFLSERGEPTAVFVISPRSAGPLTVSTPRRARSDTRHPQKTKNKNIPQAASRLERLDAAETHLDAAEAEAAAAELRALEVADAMYTVRHRLTGAPRAAPTLRLDASLVSEHDLIDARTLMATNEARRAARLNVLENAPAGSSSQTFRDEARSVVPSGTKRPSDDVETIADTAEPSYAASTKSAENRAAARAERLLETVPPFRKSDSGEAMTEEEWARKTRAARARAAERASEMGPSRREVEERVLRRMRARANFVPNPRHALSETPDKFEDVFVLDPPTVRFSEYTAGETYEARLTIRNKSRLSRRVRVLPAASRYFSVAECVFPSEHGMLAPGMACWTVVRFRPESLADYEDFVAVAGETSRGRVTLVAKRHPPRLTIDPVVDVGPVLVGGNVEFRVPFKNVGGRGRFRLVDEKDWPDRTTPLVLPDETADLSPFGERHEDSPTPCISLGPFRVGPGVLELEQNAVEKLRVGFAPPRVGAFTRNFRAVCDNGQVKTFAVTGVGTVLDVAVAAIDGRDVAAGELARVGDSYALARSAPPPLRFGACEPGSVTRRVFAVRNATKVPVPFEWDLPDPDAEDDGDDDARAFSVTPRSGILGDGAEIECVATFAPRSFIDSGNIAGRFRLVVDAAFPPRTPLNGAAMFAKPVVVEDFRVAGVAAPHDVTLDAHLVHFAGALLPGRHYDREVRLTNVGTAPCAFAWAGADAPPRGGAADEALLVLENETARREGEGDPFKVSSGSRILVYPEAGAVAPGDTVTCVVEVTAPDAARVDRHLRCVCEDGPTLPLRVTGEVHGPEVVVAQSAIDFGLLRRGAPGDTYVTLRNPSAVPCAWRVEERRAGVESVEKGSAPVPLAPEIVFSASNGVLPANGEIELECTLRATRAGAYRGSVSVFSGGKTKAGAVVYARADVLDPRAALDTTRVDLGVAFVGVPVTRVLTLRNMTMLPAAFRWSAAPEGEDEDSDGAMRFSCDCPSGELAPGGARAVRFDFTPTRPPPMGAKKKSYAALVACDVEGARAPLGFELEAEIRGLEGNVAFDVRRGSDGALVASSRRDDAASRAVAALDARDEQTLGADLGDDCRVDFGDACQVREHAVMELVVRNATAIETEVSLRVERFGVRDATAREATARRRDAADAAAGGRGGGGRDATRGGARALGGLAGGDGVVSATLAQNSEEYSSVAESESSGRLLNNALDDAEKKALDARVFGAVATAGPAAFAASMRRRRDGEDFFAGETHRPRAFHLPGGFPGGGELSFSNAGGDAGGDDAKGKGRSSRRDKRRAIPAFARPKLSDKHETVSFSRGAGAKMAGARDSAAADARALREAGEAGVAFALSASRGVLPAFGEFRVFVTCVSDAPGEYADAIQCAVGHLPARRIPVRAGVAGSPLEVRPTRHAPAGASAARLGVGRRGNESVNETVIHGPSPAFGLDWGEVPVGERVPAKRFFCVNRGPFDAEVAFTPWLNPVPGDVSAYYAGDEAETRCASVRLVPDEIGGVVEVRVVGMGVMCARRGPFRVVPSGPTLVPKNGGVVEFVVSYEYEGDKPRVFVGSVVSKCRLLPHSDGSSRDSSTERVRLDISSAVATATLASRAEGKKPSSPTARRAEARPARVRLAGAFHAYAAPPPTPMKPLTVRLSARAFAPRVVPDAPVNFSWRCRASQASVESSEYRKAVTLTNPHAETVAFRLTCPPPFEVLDAEASTPQASLRRPDETASPTAPPTSLRAERSAHREADSVVGLRKVLWRVPAKQSLHVTLRFAPPAEDVDDAGAPVRETDEKHRQRFDGALVLLYENGDAQHFALDAQLIRPTLRASTRRAEFGKVHVRHGSERVANLRAVTLANDSGDEARWVAETRGAFFCEPGSGIVAAGGRAVVEIGMRPSAEEAYEGAVAFRVEEGRGCDVACVGEGTLDEAEDA